MRMFLFLFYFINALIIQEQVREWEDEDRVTEGQGSIEHFVLGSMLAVASRSIARFALLEYRFAVEDWGISSWF